MRYYQSILIYKKALKLLYSKLPINRGRIISFAVYLHLPIGPN